MHVNIVKMNALFTFVHLLMQNALFHEVWLLWNCLYSVATSLTTQCHFLFCTQCNIGLSMCWVVVHSVWAALFYSSMLPLLLSMFTPRPDGLFCLFLCAIMVWNIRACAMPDMSLKNVLSAFLCIKSLDTNHTRWNQFWSALKKQACFTIGCRKACTRMKRYMSKYLLLDIFTVHLAEAKLYTYQQAVDSKSAETWFGTGKCRVLWLHGKKNLFW